MQGNFSDSQRKKFPDVCPQPSDSDNCGKYLYYTSDFSFAGFAGLFTSFCWCAPDCLLIVTILRKVINKKAALKGVRFSSNCI